MVLNGILITVAALVVGVAILGYTPLPEGIRDPSTVRLIQGFLKISSHISWACDYLGFVKAPLLMKYSTAGRLDKEPDSASWGTMKVTRDKIAGVPVIIYRPKDALKLSPAVVFFHGGGWVVGSPDLYDKLTHYYAEKTNLVVISVDYRKAPEHIFPAAAEDCVEVTKYVLRHGDQYGVDVKKVGVSGDSAGGNLAAVVALRLSQEKSDLPPLKFQILHYPVVQGFDLRLPSFADCELPLLTRNAMGVYYAVYAGFDVNNIQHYATVLTENRHLSPEFKKSKYAANVDVKQLPKEFQTPNKTLPEVTAPYDAEVFAKVKDMVVDPLFSPLMSPKLSGPPAFIHVCEFDILRDDALLYAKRLKDAGVKVELHFGKGGFHGDIIFIHPEFLFTSSAKAALSATFSFIENILKE